MENEQVVIQGTADPVACGCTGVDSVVYADLFGSWSATDQLTFRLGVDNLTDEEPQLYTPDQDSGTNPSVYDVIGRRYYASVNYAF
jgi:outer membrane receptor protein involved in Fe transport